VKNKQIKLSVSHQLFQTEVNFRGVMIFRTIKKLNSVAWVRPSDRRLSAKLTPTFADTGCHVVGVIDPYGRILGFLERSRYFFK
jgi:CBS-domain-containing membrane protein